jgi:hypothetical protein
VRGAPPPNGATPRVGRAGGGGYSSWLNLVERWFAELTTKSIKRSAHRSVRDLVASLRTWITNCNEDPKPYVWHKTADEILDSLANYCQTNQRLRSLGAEVHETLRGAGREDEVAVAVQQSRPDDGRHGDIDRVVGVAELADELGDVEVASVEHQRQHTVLKDILF